MSSVVPKVKFNNGLEVPVLGLGTWKSQPDVVEEAIKYAIDIGYRHIDGACIYLNEKNIGIALAEKIKDGTVKREDLFITSKLWNNFHNPSVVEKACRASLENLGLDYLDLYLIHFPFGFADGEDLGPRNENGEIVFSDWDYLDTWKGMENLISLGLVKSIGVSNFNKRQLERLLDNCVIKPVTNQVECHPYLPQLKLGDWMSKHKIILTAYSPLGSPDRPDSRENEPNLLLDQKLKSVAKKYNKTAAQLLIRYHLDRGFVVVPKSTNKQRMKENFAIFDFQISNEDMDTLNSFECNQRYLTMKGFGDTHKYYPFNDEY